MHPSSCFDKPKERTVTRTVQVPARVARALGTEDHVQFYRCEACGDVFVGDAGPMGHVEGASA